VGIFLRFTAFLVFLAFVAAGFLEVAEYRDSHAISTAELVIRGWIPVIVGFVLAWGLLGLAERADTRPCPRCGWRVYVDAYACPNCGLNFGRAGGNVAPV
jgi:hypothetical protein